MSDTVKLSARLAADDELNGLDAIAPALLADPAEVTVAIVWLDVAKITTDVDSGTRVPTVRIRRIEPLGTPASTQPAIRKLAEELMHQRTGRTPLPFDIIDHDGE